MTNVPLTVLVMVRSGTPLIGMEPVLPLALAAAPPPEAVAVLTTPGLTDGLATVRVIGTLAPAAMGPGLWQATVDVPVPVQVNPPPPPDTSVWPPGRLSARAIAAVVGPEPLFCTVMV